MGYDASVRRQNNNDDDGDNENVIINQNGKLAN